MHDEPRDYITIEDEEGKLVFLIQRIVRPF
jgi:hypothetical protein